MAHKIYTPSQKLSLFTYCAFTIQITLGLVALFSSFYEYQQLEAFDKDLYDDLVEAVRQIEATDNRQIIIGSLQFLSFGLSSFLFCLWFSKICTYTRRVSEQKARFAPWICTCSWFIPFAQCILPYLCLRESWKLLVAQKKGYVLIALWWILLLAFILFKFLSIQSAQKAQDVQALLVTNNISQISDAITVLLAITSILVILLFHQNLSITAKKEKKHSTK